MKTPLTDRFGQLLLSGFASRFKPMPAEDAAPCQEGLSPERRNRIVAGAAAIFVAEGYEGASMSQIAACANVSKGTLYNYFPNKRALFAAFVRDRCNFVLNELFADLRTEAPVAEELQRLGGALLRLIISPVSLSVFRVIMMEAEKFPDLALIYYTAGTEAVVRRITVWMAAQDQAGNLTVPDPKLAAEQFLILIQARLVLRCRFDLSYKPGDEEIDYVLRSAVSVFLAAYGPAARQRPETRPR